MAGRKKPVIDLDTGEEWESSHKCAKDLGINQSSLSSCINKGYLTLGRRIVYKGEEEAWLQRRNQIVTRHKSTKLIDLDTGEEFEGICDCANKLGTVLSNVQKGLKKGYLVKGRKICIKGGEEEWKQKYRAIYHMNPDTAYSPIEITYIDLDSKEEWEGIVNCAKALNISSSNIFYGIRNIRAINGRRICRKGEEKEWLKAWEEKYGGSSGMNRLPNVGDTVWFKTACKADGNLFTRTVKGEVIHIAPTDLHPIKIRGLDGTVYYAAIEDIQNRKAKADKKIGLAFTEEQVQWGKAQAVKKMSTIEKELDQVKKVTNAGTEKLKEERKEKEKSMEENKKTEEKKNKELTPGRVAFEFAMTVGAIIADVEHLIKETNPGEEILTNWKLLKSCAAEGAWVELNK